MARNNGLEVAKALDRNLRSENCLDENLEVANVVDGLYAVARAIGDLASAMFGQAEKRPSEERITSLEGSRTRRIAPVSQAKRSASNA